MVELYLSTELSYQKSAQAKGYQNGDSIDFISGKLVETSMHLETQDFCDGKDVPSIGNNFSLEATLEDEIKKVEERVENEME